MKILAIDDDELIHKLYDVYLNELMTGYEMESCYNGLDGIRYMEKCLSGNFEGPDIILLDINMPIMDGVEFLNEFEKLAYGLKKLPSIFVITSSLITGDYLRNLKYVTGVFGKPVFKNTLKDLIFNQMQYD